MTEAVWPLSFGLRCYDRKMLPPDLLERIDRRLCQIGLLRPASWPMISAAKQPKLYAGGLSRALPQFKTHIGITPFDESTRNIRHDVRAPFPIADNSIDLFQSEDVFEHIPYSEVPPVIEEIYRVLKPGGLFRLSVPDYRCPILRDRSLKKCDGEILFDPGGGGDFVDGAVINGGHVWFPTYETVQSLMKQSNFQRSGTITFLHYTLENGDSVLDPIDYSLGHVQRTPDHDDRVRSLRCAMSIVVDAVKTP
jgi:SAM-dependent methyltransferase